MSCRDLFYVVAIHNCVLEIWKADMHKHLFFYFVGQIFCSDYNLKKMPVCETFLFLRLVFAQLKQSVKYNVMLCI